MSLQGPKGPRTTAVETEEGHVPVMVEEVIESLAPAPGSFQIDATVGGGGHSLRILEANSPDGRLLGLDADGAAIARTRKRLERFGDRATLAQTNFEHLADVAAAANFVPADGVLFDLGLSSYQLADDDRAFSFRAEGPLDMRFDTSRGVPASDIVNTLRRTAADRAVPQVRRGAERATHRAGDRPSTRSGTDQHRHAASRSGGRRLCRSPSRQAARPPSHARVPGASNRG